MVLFLTGFTLGVWRKEIWCCAKALLRISDEFKEKRKQKGGM